MFGQMTARERVAFALCGALLGKTTLFVVGNMKAAREIRRIIKDFHVPRTIARRLKVKTVLQMPAPRQVTGVFFDDLLVDPPCPSKS